MGTYSDESPDASIGERVANSIRKIAGMPKHPEKAEPKNPTAGGETPQESTDRMAGGVSDADTSSNTGEAGQSTNAANKY